MKIKENYLKWSQIFMKNYFASKDPHFSATIYSNEYVHNAA